MGVQADLSGLLGDDLTFNLALTYNGQPLNLTGVQAVTAYLKPYATSPDSSGKTYTIGSGLTITSSTLGELTWFIPHADVPGNGWYRVTVTDATSHLATPLYGRLNITEV